MRNDERVFGSSKLRAKESLVAAKLSTYLFKNASRFEPGCESFLAVVEMTTGSDDEIRLAALRA